jgi:spermidine synthase
MPWVRLIFIILSCASIGVSAEDTRYEIFDTSYNTLIIEQRGTVVEMRSRRQRNEFSDSAVDLSDPLKLLHAHARLLFAPILFNPEPRRVLMIGLGGAAFHRVFAAAFPTATLQTAEIDEKVFELARSRMAFRPSEKTPVAIMDGRQYIKRHPEKWDWIILDAYRGGFVPPHLKTVEFYRECAARLNDRGVLVCNLLSRSGLFFSDLKTISNVFQQLAIFDSGAGNVIACAVNYRLPALTDKSSWTASDKINPVVQKSANVVEVARYFRPIPTREMSWAQLLTDDFAPVEYLDSVKVPAKR